MVLYTIVLKHDLIIAFQFRIFYLSFNINILKVMFYLKILFMI